jgi:signal transduction histidine kinase
MKAAPIPPDDEERLAELYRYALLDTPVEQAFEDLTALAAHILDVPISLVSLVDRDRQWFKSRRGLSAAQTARDVSFCGHAVASKDVLVVSNAFEDERFADNPLVTDEPRVVFYVGVPLITSTGYALGTICGIDHEPREVSREQLDLVSGLARQAMNQIELRLQLKRSDDLLRRREEIERQKDAFISLVNHELRTPLTSIHGSLRLMHAGMAGELGERAQKLVAVAERNAKRLTVLISDLLDLDRVRLGEMTLNLTDVDVATLIERCLENNRPFADEEGVALVSEAVVAEQTLVADPDRLLQVLDNLISNAIKYSPAGESVVVGATVTSDCARLTVRDVGPGVPEAFRDRIFERFAQSDVTPRSKKPGSGLGLAIAKAFVLLHDGSLYYEANEPTGARFVVELPRANPNA